MREKLNENPMAQVGLILVLVVAAVVIFIGSSGGEEESEEVPAGEVAASVNGVTATGSSPGEAVESAVESLEAGAAEASTSGMPTSVPAPPLPRKVTAAYDEGKTVVLLIVNPDSINDRLVVRSALLLAAARDVMAFVVPANQIARYAAITVGLDVNRVPALVVMKPKRLDGGTPQASVDYGFQTPQSVLQAVLDANYHGRELTYHPN